MIKKEDVKVGLRFTLPVVDHCFGITPEDIATEFGTQNVRFRIKGGCWDYTFSIIAIKDDGSLVVGSSYTCDGVRIIPPCYVEEFLSEAMLLENIDTQRKKDNINHPSHYAWLKDLCGVEPLDICRHLDFNVGNALKYILRKDKVDGNKTKTEKRVEDLRKAIFYIEDEIKLLELGKETL